MKKRGFTIVELLVVIVIIAILAAISLVSFNGVRQRANNTKTIAAVKQLINLTYAYRAAYGTEPWQPGVTQGMCGTADNHCTTSAPAPNTRDNTPLMEELAKVGTPPRETGAATSSGHYGVQYIYLTATTATFNGQASLVRLEYWLEGTNVNCGVQNVAASPSNTNATVSSTSGYTSSSSSPNLTSCSVRI